MNRSNVINVFKKELKYCDPDSKMAQAMELAIEIMHADKRRISNQQSALMKISKPSNCRSGF